ncbi:hypothetical protein ACH5RR_035007 [Cinchona calisaya]|uniref:Uncharacterized protein n=1 Tax=Cinchona calisaya TaxID=153742 RepID=A0ABD2YEN4_9GENT
MLRCEEASCPFQMQLSIHKHFSDAWKNISHRTVEALLVCDFAVLGVISDIKPWKHQHGRTFSKLPERSGCASLVCANEGDACCWRITRVYRKLWKKLSLEMETFP